MSRFNERYAINRYIRSRTRISQVIIAKYHSVEKFEKKWLRIPTLYEDTRIFIRRFFVFLNRKLPEKRTFYNKYNVKVLIKTRASTSCLNSRNTHTHPYIYIVKPRMQSGSVYFIICTIYALIKLVYT